MPTIGIVHDVNISEDLVIKTTATAGETLNKGDVVSLYSGNIVKKSISNYQNPNLPALGIVHLGASSGKNCIITLIGKEYTTYNLSGNPNSVAYVDENVAPTVYTLLI